LVLGYHLLVAASGSTVVPLLMMRVGVGGHSVSQQQVLVMALLHSSHHSPEQVVTDAIYLVDGN
jgi:hypothetical protein